MIKKFFQNILNRSRKKHVGEWASFEVIGFEDDGRIKVQTNWNDAFIKKIYELGFQAETEEESVQLFFYTAQARPTGFDSEDEVAISSSHPNLQNDTNILRT